MKLKSLVKALDTTVDYVEVYTTNWDLMFKLETYYAEKSDTRIKKFRVYETEEATILMVTV